MADFRGPAGAFVKRVTVEELDKLFKNLPDDLRNKAIAIGTRAAAKLVERRAKPNVPRGETLVLAKTLTVRAAKRDKGQRLSKGYQGHAVTHATKKSVTTATQKLGLSGKKGRYAGDPYYSQWLEWGSAHITELRYLRNALYQSREETLAVVKKATEEGVIKIAAKARAKIRG